MTAQRTSIKAKMASQVAANMAQKTGRIQDSEKGESESETDPHSDENDDYESFESIRNSDVEDGEISTFDQPRTAKDDSDAEDQDDTTRFDPLETLIRPIGGVSCKTFFIIYVL